jgi:hypothetical protein
MAYGKFCIGHQKAIEFLHPPLIFTLFNTIVTLIDLSSYFCMHASDLVEIAMSQNNLRILRSSVVRSPQNIQQRTKVQKQGMPANIESHINAELLAIFF